MLKPSQAYLDELNQALKNNQAQTVVDICSEILKNYSNNLTQDGYAKLLGDRAIAYSKLGNIEEATKDFIKAIQHADKKLTLQWLREVLASGANKLAETVYTIAIAVHGRAQEFEKIKTILDMQTILKYELQDNYAQEFFNFLNAAIEQYPDEKYFANIKQKTITGIFNSLGFQYSEMNLQAGAKIRIGGLELDVNAKGDLSSDSVNKLLSKITQQLMQQAKYFFEKGDYATATSKYTQIISSTFSDKPTLAQAYVDLGKIAASEHNFIQALSYYQQALQAKPDNHVAQYGICEVFVQQEKLPEAFECFKQIPETSPLYQDAQDKMTAIVKSAGAEPGTQLLTSAAKGLSYTAVMNLTKHTLAKQKFLSCTPAQADLIVKSLSVAFMYFNEGPIAASAAGCFHIASYMLGDKSIFGIVAPIALGVGIPVYTHSFSWKTAQAVGSIAAAGAASIAGFWFTEKLAEKTGLKAAPEQPAQNAAKMERKLR